MPKQRGLSFSLGCFLAAAAPYALAQTAVERNLPPVPVPSAAPIVTPDVVPASQDATPLGVNLRAIVLLGVKDSAYSDASVPNGVHQTKVPMLDRPETRFALTPFIGRPLSRKLIAEIQAEIARQSRAVERPFVSMSTPEQEITGGVLQIRVTEFKAGKVGASGVEGPAAETVTRGIRLQPGQSIHSGVLSEDLDWLNRNPFRQVSALFSPASAEFETDVAIKAELQRPYRVFAGWANSGSESTGLGRTFVGGVATVPGLRDAYVSYQLTGSNDFWKEGSSYFNSEPRYVAQGVRLYIPTLPRQNIELTLSDAKTNQVVNADFSVRQRTSEATLGYRMALSTFGLPAGSGDVLVAIEAKRQHRQVFFGGENALDLSADAWQMMGGWSKGWQGNGSQALAAVNLHVSPGGVSDRSSSERIAELTNGRVTSDKYSYLTIDLSGAKRLNNGMAITTQLSGQIAAKVLPLSAQIGLGGEGLVRGYSADDGSFDSGIVSRTELRLPAMSLVKFGGEARDQFAPFIFLDAGHGRDRSLKVNATLMAAGAGADYTFGKNLSVGLNAARALRDGQTTQSGEWRVQARATVTF